MKPNATVTGDSTLGEASGTPENAELHAALERLRKLVQDHPIAEARVFVNQLANQWPDDPGVQYWSRVLAPPTTRTVPGPRHRPLDREYAWLREHARDYPGCWLAVLDDRLIAADPSFREVMSAVRRTPGAETSLLHYQMPDVE
jgi:hypothetical protein